VFSDDEHCHQIKLRNKNNGNGNSNSNSNNTGIGFVEKYNVLAWCAIDDLNLLAYEQSIKNQAGDDVKLKIEYKFLRNHFVRTDPFFGLTFANAYQMIDILNSK
jgi:hypothetical protein